MFISGTEDWHAPSWMMLVLGRPPCPRSRTTRSLPRRGRSDAVSLPSILICYPLGGRPRRIALIKVLTCPAECLLPNPAGLIIFNDIVFLCKARKKFYDCKQVLWNRSQAGARASSQFSCLMLTGGPLATPQTLNWNWNLEPGAPTQSSRISVSMTVVDDHAWQVFTTLSSSAMVLQLPAYRDALCIIDIESNSVCFPSNAGSP